SSGVVEYRHVVRRYPVHAACHEMRDSLYDILRWCRATGLQYHGCVRRLVLRTERRLLVQREMNLRRLHTRHLADRAFELSFESAPVIDSLREVSHPPR